MSPNLHSVLELGLALRYSGRLELRPEVKSASTQRLGRNFLGWAASLLVCILAAGALAACAGEGGSGGSETQSVIGMLDQGFRHGILRPLASAFFFDLIFWDNDQGIANRQLPFIVLWLIAGATFFTLRFRFISLRAFWHAVTVARGDYDHPDDAGEVSHFQALSSALSATVGLGNIGGVAVAIGMGGPGAVVWMIIAGFLGMSSKFTECTLGQLYREVDAQGHISGGPMRYLQRGLSDLRRRTNSRFGRLMSVLFAYLCVGASFGAGNMFQANQSYAQLAKLMPAFQGATGSLLYGIALALLVGVVIVGGIRRIGSVAGVIVPFMCAIYLLAGFWVLFANAAQIPAALREILRQSLNPEAGYGGVIGVMVVGFQRAAFSNEAGTGSSSIAHAAAATDEPVREGIVALLEPFIDTIVVCTMTALIVVVTGAYKKPDEGVLMTSNAFATAIPWFPIVLTVAVFLFAFSTMISWSYYGERCWSFLFGQGSSLIYRLAFLAFVVLGSVLPLSSVIEFADLMILGMAFINIAGLMLLSGRVARALDDYWGRYRAGRMLAELHPPRSDSAVGEPLP